MDDVDTITAHWVALVEGQREYGAHLRGTENESAARSIIEQYVHAAGIGVARGHDGTTVAGFVMFHVERGLYEQDVRRGIVENVYVDPRHRGDGFGSALLEYAEERLDDAGVDVLSLSVLVENERARDWYEDRGYSPHRVTLERPVGDADT
ncbi:MAG: GNAT family N-acetyltransferase [Halobacteriota archaeon]